MNKKTNNNKDKKYSMIQNDRPPAKVLSDEEFQATQSIVKIDKMDMPLATVDEAKAMWQQYQDLMAALMKESDIVEIQGKKKIKKSGVNKIARFFGYSVEVLRTKKEEIVGPQGGRQFIWYAWVRAIAPNGRFRVEGAACSSMERRFAHLHHDVLATAITRASNRAIQELAGMGELELSEDDNSTEQKPTMERPTKDSGIKEVGIDPEGWKPMFKARVYPSNPKLPPSAEQQAMIKNELEQMEVNPDNVVFKLNNRNDGVPVEKKMNELTKGDAFDLCCAIQKGKFGDLVVEIVPIE